MTMRKRLLGCLSLLLAGLATSPAPAQRSTSTEPTTGLRTNPPRRWVLEHARIETEPGGVLEDATLVIRETAVEAVWGTGDDQAAASQPLPAGGQRIDLEGRYVYPGLIDAWSEIEVEAPLRGSETTYWNPLVSPERTAAAAVDDAFDSATADKLRQQGITARLVAPQGGIVKGTSCVALVIDNASGQRLLATDAAGHLQLTVPRQGPRPDYPNSPMGATALLRQAFYDADWYRDAHRAYASDRGLPRPEENVSLDRLGRQLRTGRWIVDAPNERFVGRAEKIAQEFSLQTILRGSGREYRLLSQVVACQRPLLLPVDFPEPPNVADPIQEREVSLQELLHWQFAPENPAKLDAAGATICLTTDGLNDLSQFLGQVRRAVARGLPEDRALAALTTHPAALLGIEDRVGRIGPGMLANLVITDGPLWDEQTRVLETWVAGKRHQHDLAKTKARTYRQRYAGQWEVTLPASPDRPAKLILELQEKGERLTGTIAPPRATAAADKSKKPKKSGPAQPTKGARPTPSASQEDDEPADHVASLQHLVLQRDRLQATFDSAAWQTAEDRSGDAAEAANGIARLRIVWIPSGRQDGTPTPGRVSVQWADGRRSEGLASRAPPTAAAAKQASDANRVAADEAAKPDDKAPPEASSPPSATEPIALRYPLGVHGRRGLPAQPACVLFRDATVWTCSAAGVIEQGDVLVREGRIVKVADVLEPPADCQIVDARGKHLTPGLIDCHSHFATDGGINESGQAVTAEVRIGDFLDSSDIDLYRQLAAGVTSSNILHGSANPIGGQNQVIKLRWGGDDDALRFDQAPAGIKFALGENVKQSNWSRPTGRYPQTRMGVEQIIRDRFLAARQYADAWQAWQTGQRETLPPRRDLELDALVEVLKGERWVHCHSYRQDEIIALLDVLEAFHVRIGTLQHILEGYKVADRMAAHGAMGSSFSDWWAYKFEVFDAIPYNGALMHRAGIVVSFNSDDRELARRLNTEAAKATKYGGVPAEEALKFVTLNPAKQLRIDQHVGSIEAGKHADLVLWSDRPLGTFARCEQTWIDGRRFFDRQADAEQRVADQRLRTRLIQQILRGDEPAGGDAEDAIPEEQRWVRYDAFCQAHGIVHRDDQQQASQAETNQNE